MPKKRGKIRVKWGKIWMKRRAHEKKGLRAGDPKTKSPQPRPLLPPSKVLLAKEQTGS
jgi:hypothetical protein